MSKEYAIYDTEIDMFITKMWSENMCHRILKSWKFHHPERNMSRYELRVRLYPDDDGYDNSAILVIDKSLNKITCFYHWGNRHYCNAYNPNEYIFVKYIPPKGIEITDIYKRFDMQDWDGKGEIINQWG
jgi:hypothetical protein